jgi:two-component system response regulator RegX3
LTEKKSRILIIEDEMAIAEGLVDLCVFKGYEAHHCSDGADGLKEALSSKYDLVILDLMLPGLDGFSVCNGIREKDRELPVIILSAKTSESDIIEGLKLGADDYVPKPFSVGQLFARIEAVLRRSRKMMENDDNLQLGPLRINFRDFSGYINDEIVPFTRKEMEILYYITSNADRPVSRNELLREVWGYGNADSIDTRTVDIHITKLRKKIEDDPAHPRYLVTLRGEGYQLRVPPYEST